ncbi:MAG TPA: ATP-binding protein [Thermoanaerobaculaceae bacterium]|nr:ATP-binding protein [Thermoanaerobaculaceae bacterium]HRS17076.1 ATP-binding protein [Thermoanaerobaculaceae bacterium]
MWRWRSDSLTFRLTGTVLGALVVLLGLAATIQVSLQERFARGCASINGLALTETLYGALHTSMLANDREGMHATVRAIGEKSPAVQVRVFNKEGEIAFSSRADEVGTRLPPGSEGCVQCHREGQPTVATGDLTRAFVRDGRQVLGIIKPIVNEPSCTSTCHAHPPEKRLLGMLDVTLTLGKAAEARRQTTWLMLATTLGALVLVAGVVLVVVRRAVHDPIREITTTLEALGAGDYGARVGESSISEFRQLGSSLNSMAHELQQANQQLVEWAQTLERRVEERTAELRQAQEQVIAIERMASLGKLAAVVAHEINNPLASVVTYSKLLVRRFRAAPAGGDTRENLEILEAIAAESARCGEIVSNLLLFARKSGTRFEPTDLNELARRCLFLLKHKMDLAQVQAQTQLDAELPPVVVDPAQIEQALLALAINAIEAMPGGGTLSVRTRPLEGGGAVVEVADTGVGMDEEVRKQIFEPFFTTKGEGEGRGLGLGLAVVYGIVHRHGGEIEVASEPARGTTFTLKLPGRGESAEEGR